MSAITVQKRALGSSSGGAIISKKAKKMIQQARQPNEIDAVTKLSKCFHKFTAKMYISLAPMYLNDPVKGIKQQHLDPLLMNFLPEAKGVILSYTKLQFLRNDYGTADDGSAVLLGKVKYDTPYSFLWVSVDFLVWRPVVGDVIEGYSYMQTPSHIGLLVHDTFNANIKKYNIPSSWEFVPNADDENDNDNAAEEEGENKGNFRSLGYWVDENGVKVDGELRFTIKAIHTAGKLVTLEGTLIKPGEENSQDYNAVKKPLGNHKKFYDEQDDGFANTSLTGIPEPVKEDLEDVPTYEKEEESDEEKVIAEADSSEDEDDDD